MLPVPYNCSLPIAETISSPSSDECGACTKPSIPAAATSTTVAAAETQFKQHQPNQQPSWVSDDDGPKNPPPTSRCEDREYY